MDKYDTTGLVNKSNAYVGILCRENNNYQPLWIINKHNCFYYYHKICYDFILYDYPNRLRKSYECFSP